MLFNGVEKKTFLKNSGKIPENTKPQNITFHKNKSSVSDKKSDKSGCFLTDLTEKYSRKIMKKFQRL